MTFLNPIVLIGLAAAAIPILIHLLQLKKLRQVEFSSIRFLKEIQHASARRVKLRDYLLLLLRTLAIASLVVAFSRPAIKGFLGTNSKTSSMVIVDDSPSTAARNEYGGISSQIKNVSAGILKSFQPGDDAGLIAVSAEGDSANLETTADPVLLAARLAGFEPSDVSGSYTSAIGEALRRLDNSGYANREIYVVGDMQKSEFRDPARMNIPPRTRVFFIQTEESPNDNLSVSAVRIVDPVVEVNSASRVEATVRNNDGSDKRGVVVSLYLDKRKVAQSVVDISAGTSRNVDLSFAVSSPGYHRGSVRIDDNSIQSDNEFFFSFYAIQRLRVVVIGNRQGSDYMTSAAEAVNDTATVIDMKVVTSEQFPYTSLRGVDVVVAESYPSLSAASGAGLGFQNRVEQFVEDGGGVVLFAPPEHEINSYAALLDRLKLGTVTRLLPGSSEGFLSLDRIDASDDFFLGIFTSDESFANLKSRLVTKIYSGAVIQPDPFSHVLMSTSSGPFMLSREVGDGYALAFATGADTSSSDFPLSPFFPVVIQRALFYSASVKHRPIEVRAGKPVEYEYPGAGIRSAVLISPSGELSDVTPRFVGTMARFELGPLDDLGTYVLAAPDTICEISVNVDDRESDLSQESATEIKAYARKLGFAGENVFVVPAGMNTVSEINKLRLGTDLSSIFAAAAFVFLVAEIFVSRMKTL